MPALALTNAPTFSAARSERPSAGTSAKTGAPASSRPPSASDVLAIQKQAAATVGSVTPMFLRPPAAKPIVPARLLALASEPVWLWTSSTNVVTPDMRKAEASITRATLARTAFILAGGEGGG